MQGKFNIPWTQDHPIQEIKKGIESQCITIKKSFRESNQVEDFLTKHGETLYIIT